MLINNNKISAEKIIFYITFLIFLIIGIRSFQDYGISLDEKWHRETGLLFYNFIKGLFFFVYINPLKIFLHCLSYTNIQSFSNTFGFKGFII